MKKRRILIAGGNAAGCAAAAAVKRLLPDAEVVLFEASDYISTGTCEFPFIISGEISHPEKLLFFTPAAFTAEKAVSVIPRATLVSINRKEKSVVISKEGTYSTEHYDQLIIATGAFANSDNQVLQGTENFFTVKHYPDLLRLDAFFKNNVVTDAVVIGSGYIGLEFADALRNRGIQVTLLEKSSRLFPAGEKRLSSVIQNIAQQSGIRSETGVIRTIYRYTGNSINSVVTGSRVIETQLVLSATGITPNVQVAAQAGLKIGKYGGIVVNPRMQTSDDSIYACGDCTELPGLFLKPTGYFPTAVLAREAAYTVANTIAGGRKILPSVYGTTSFRFCQQFITQIGITSETASKLGYAYKIIEVTAPGLVKIMPDSIPCTISAVVQIPSGKVLGAGLVGGEQVSAFTDVLSVCIRNGLSIETLQNIEFNYTPPLSPFVNPLHLLAKKFSH